MTPTHAPERGSVLAVALLVVALLFVIAGGLGARSAAEARLGRAQYMAERAFFAAEAGLDRVIACLYQSGPDLDTCYPPAERTAWQPVADGAQQWVRVDVTVTDLGGGNRRFDLLAEGAAAREGDDAADPERPLARSRLRMLVQHTAGTVAVLAYHEAEE